NTDACPRARWYVFTHNDTARTALGALQPADVHAARSVVDPRHVVATASASVGRRGVEVGGGRATPWLRAASSANGPARFCSPPTGCECLSCVSYEVMPLVHGST